MLFERGLLPLGNRFNSDVRRHGIDFNPQNSEDYFVYSVAPNPTSISSGISGTLAPGASASVNLFIEQESWFEWHETTVSANLQSSDNTPLTDNISTAPDLSIQVNDTFAGRYLFNEMIPVALVAGVNSQFPHRLPIPRRFAPTATVAITITNNSSVAMNRIQLNLIGRKIWQGRDARPIERFSAWVDRKTRKVMCEDYFAYHFTIPALAAGVSTTISQLVEADSDFEALSLSGSIASATAGFAAQLPDYLLIRLEDAGSQRKLSNTPVVGPSTAGFAGNPSQLPVPRIFMGKAQIQIFVSNISTGTAITRGDIILSGRKIFEFDR